MKQINTYISEKLVINKHVNVNNDVLMIYSDKGRVKSIYFDSYEESIKFIQVDTDSNYIFLDGYVGQKKYLEQIEDIALGDGGEERFKAIDKICKEHDVIRWVDYNEIKEKLVINKDINLDTDNNIDKAVSIITDRLSEKKWTSKEDNEEFYDYEITIEPHIKYSYVIVNWVDKNHGIPDMWRFKLIFEKIDQLIKSKLKCTSWYTYGEKEKNMTFKIFNG